MVLQTKMIDRVKRERKILAATSKYVSISLRLLCLTRHVYRYPEMFVRLHCSFQNRKYLFLVLDFVQGGDCLTLITYLGTVPERITRLIVAEVIYAVKFLHSHGIVHRDIC